MTLAAWHVSAAHELGLQSQDFAADRAEREAKKLNELAAAWQSKTPSGTIESRILHGRPVQRAPRGLSRLRALGRRTVPRPPPRSRGLSDGVAPASCRLPGGGRTDGRRGGAGIMSGSRSTMPFDRVISHSDGAHPREVIDTGLHRRPITPSMIRKPPTSMPATAPMAGPAATTRSCRRPAALEPHRDSGRSTRTSAPRSRSRRCEQQAIATAETGFVVVHDDEGCRGGDRPGLLEDAHDRGPQGREPLHMAHEPLRPPVRRARGCFRPRRHTRAPTTSRAAPSRSSMTATAWRPPPSWVSPDKASA